MARYATLLLLALTASCAGAGGSSGGSSAVRPAAAPDLVSRSALILERDGLRFKDLNRNGELDPYEDWRRSPEERARDLVGRMTLEEKAGAMMHGTARSTGPMGGPGAGAGYAWRRPAG